MLLMRCQIAETLKSLSPLLITKNYPLFKLNFANHTQRTIVYLRSTTDPF